MSGEEVRISCMYLVFLNGLILGVHRNPKRLVVLLRSMRRKGRCDTHIRTHTRAHTRTRTRTHTCTHARVHTHTRTDAHTHTHTDTHTHRRTHTHTHTHTHTRSSWMADGKREA